MANNSRIITIGIDLGTTNSEIAVVSDDGQVEIVKNSLGEEFTPSVFHVDKNGNYSVGRRAYKKLYGNDEDARNTKSEVKRLMGTDSEISFSRAKRKMKPEEVSAEILKSLKSDAVRKYGDINATGVVITVPAYFDSLQNEATKRAGKLAGFDYVVLLQEPIAAALAYGYDTGKNANWLVYDLGGGTFDVALISANNGILSVVEHGGDNFLGGKDIDNLIVEKVLIPRILEEYDVSSLRGKISHDGEIYRKLKVCAEEIKIALTTSESYSEYIDSIGCDDDGKDIEFNINYGREEFNRLITPIVDKTIEITNRVLDDSSIKRSSVERIVLVGGPTQIPFLRDSLREKIGVNVDTSVDPLTTVARGACIYGMSQQIPDDLVKEEVPADAVKVRINYDSVSSESEQLVTGTIDGLDDGEYYVKISSNGGYYDSAKIRVKDGKFFDTVALEPGKLNTFWVYLIDDKGNSIPTVPDSFTITHGFSVQGVPIPHNLGVVYAKKDVSTGEYKDVFDVYFRRGDILPLEKTQDYRTITKITKGEDGDLPIEVIEGDDLNNPANNRVITTLSIKGDELPHDLPSNTEISITISINESREVSVEAYIPDIDESFDVRVDAYSKEADRATLTQDVRTEQERLRESSMSKRERDELSERLSEIKEGLRSDDRDSREKADRDLQQVRRRIDDAERSSATKRTEEDYESRRDHAKQTIMAVVEDEDEKEQLMQQIERIDKTAERAIASGDEGELRYCIEEIESLGRKAVVSSDGFWLYMLEKLKKRPLSDFSNPSRARSLFEQIETAESRGDMDEIKSSMAALFRLLPDDESDEMGGFAGITR